MYMAASIKNKKINIYIYIYTYANAFVHSNSDVEQQFNNHTSPRHSADAQDSRSKVTRAKQQHTSA